MSGGVFGGNFCGQDLGVGAEVVAIVLPLHHLDTIQFWYDLSGDGGVAVNDEYEIRCIVERMLDEVSEVHFGGRGL